MNEEELDALINELLPDSDVTGEDILDVVDDPAQMTPEVADVIDVIEPEVAPQELTVPFDEMSLDDQIASLEAQRDPIRQALVDADSGAVPLSPEEYANLLEQHKPLFDQEMALKQERLKAAQEPIIMPDEQSETIFNNLTRELTEEEVASLQYWQGNGYGDIQGNLYRSGKKRMDSFVKETIDTIDGTMDTIYQADINVLYRGQTSGLENLKVGQTLESNLYAATSADLPTAGGFSKSAGSVAGRVKEGDVIDMLRITPDGVKGIAIPGSDEYEVLLQRNAKFKVTGFSQETVNGVIYRFVEVLAYGG
jgi:hypothetical protein